MQILSLLFFETAKLVKKWQDHKRNITWRFSCTTAKRIKARFKFSLFYLSTGIFRSPINSKAHTHVRCRHLFTVVNNPNGHPEIIIKLTTPLRSVSFPFTNRPLKIATFPINRGCFSHMSHVLIRGVRTKTHAPKLSVIFLVFG